MKLLNLMSRLQGRGHAELRRQGVKDLPIEIVATKALVNFKVPKAKKIDVAKPKSNKDGSKKSKKKNSDWGKDKQPQNGSQQGKPSKADYGCFICRNPHWAKDWPKKKLNALVKEREVEVLNFSS